MRKYALILLAVLVQARSPAGDVSQEIRYGCESAGEVYLVWGVNNWQLLPEDRLPMSSFIKDRLIYTPMEKAPGGYFTAKLNLPAGTLIDYVFWITRGPLQRGTDVWDLNRPEKDYHSVASANAVTIIESKLLVKPAGALSILDFAYEVLALALLLLMVFYFSFRFRRNNTLPASSPAFIIAGASASLFLFLLLLRPSAAGISWELFLQPGSYMPQLPWLAYYDALYAGTITLLFLGLVRLFRPVPIATKIIAGIFILTALISLILAMVNIRVVELLGKPFNYQWLYYSGFLNSPDAAAAISANVSASETLRMAVVLTAAVLTGFALLIAFRRLAVFRFPRNAGWITAMGAFGVYGFIAGGRTAHSAYSYDRLANPVTAFLSSVNPFAQTPSLFTMPVADSLVYKKSKATPPLPAVNGIRNVLLFVLESTPAEYIDTYGSKYGATPNIRRLAPHSITFENVYAHAPATNLSMVALLNSTFPWLSYNSLTQEHPDFHVPSVSGELKKRGYRTAFFNSADNRYQRAGEYLGHRAFDLVTDYNSRTCKASAFSVADDSWEYMDGRDDACTAEDLSQWIARDTSRPFFAMMWTYQTHYPYFFSGPLAIYEPRDSMLNRYLNALHYGDSILGALAASLERNNLLESTLIVVTGDHGEAFGRHGQITHGRMIYEENLHVPCIFIHPSFDGRQMPAVGALTDIAPSILAQLGYPSPQQWEGSDLRAKTTGSRAYFFAPWSDYLFGYREGNFKYIYNATRDETEIYDLKTDPQEFKNLVAQKRQELGLHHQRLAAWTQHVNRVTGQILQRR